MCRSIISTIWLPLMSSGPFRMYPALLVHGGVRDQQKLSCNDTDVAGVDNANRGVF